MGELAENMLTKVKSAFKTRDLGELSLQHDQVVALREAVLAFLQHVGRAELSDAEADEHARLVAATGEIENYNEETGSFDVVLRPGTAGTANTGGGGGGASVTGFVAGNGGSGIVILLIG